MTAEVAQDRLLTLLRAVYRDGNYRDDNGVPLEPRMLAAYLAVELRASGGASS